MQMFARKLKTTNENYNVGTGKRTSLKELAELIIKITKSKKQIKYTSRSEATLVKNRIGCPEKAKKDLGFSYKIQLEEGLKKLIDWRKKEINKTTDKV